MKRRKRRSPVRNTSSKSVTLKQFGNAGIAFAWLIKGPRGKEYFAVKVYNPGPFPNTFSSSFRRVDIKTLRLAALQEYIRQAVDGATPNAEGYVILNQTELEQVLDHLYAELNRRLNRNARV